LCRGIKLTKQNKLFDKENAQSTMDVHITRRRKWIQKAFSHPGTLRRGRGSEKGAGWKPQRDRKRWVSMLHDRENRHKNDWILRIVMEEAKVGWRFLSFKYTFSRAKNIYLCWRAQETHVGGIHVATDDQEGVGPDRRETAVCQRDQSL